MGSHIWGNIYLYCWENKIDFRQVFRKLLNTELEMYKKGCEQFLVPYTHNKNNLFNKRKLVGSTLELDVDVLTSHFHIPIEEIFKSQNYLKRLIELMKTVAYDCRSGAEYESLQNL